jgi:hypothetical protein
MDINFSLLISELQYLYSPYMGNTFIQKSAFIDFVGLYIPYT